MWPCVSALRHGILRPLRCCFAKKLHATMSTSTAAYCTYEHIAYRIHLYIWICRIVVVIIINHTWCVLHCTVNIYALYKKSRNEMFRAAVARMKHVNEVGREKTTNENLSNLSVRHARMYAPFRLHNLRGVISILWANGIFRLCIFNRFRWSE